MPVLDEAGELLNKGFKLMLLTASKFGAKPALSEEFMKKVQKLPIIDHVLNWATFKADQQIKKTDGSKHNRLTGMTKLTDANNAGTKHAERCTLILTEGDSAKALAVARLGVVGRNNFGVFSLHGKLLNVREAKHDQPDALSVGLDDRCCVEEDRRALQSSAGIGGITGWAVHSKQ
ncbi:DNA topoisomerase [Suillus ampliporus]|nr:DNA topoisomerase [Suillus ampliporus]